jgi:hypothetical protein
MTLWGVEGPDGGGDTGEGALDVVVVDVEVVYLVSVGAEEPGFGSDDGIFTASLLISVVGDQDPQTVAPTGVLV